MPNFYHTSAEVVDDSEPEREELRQREKCERKRTSPAKIKRAPMAVIEISDDESTDGLSPAGTSAEAIIWHWVTELRPFDFVASPPKETVVSSNVNLGEGPHPITHDAMSDKIQSNDKDEELKNSLARFAYDAPSFNRPGLSRQPSNVSSTAGSIKPPPAKRSTHRFADFFSDPELGRVMSCVSCDIRWTARKTASQKMLHIQACAKRKALTDETIRVLLRKEIDSYVEDAAPRKGKGKEKATIEPETFLEKVVTDAAPKKKGRRLKVQETVRSVSQTRHLILDRARAVIGSTSTSGHIGSGGPDFHTQTVGIHSADSAALSSTQAFGHSALAQAQKTTSKLFNYDEKPADVEDSGSEAPTSNQTFAPSRLGRLPQPHNVVSFEQIPNDPSNSESEVTLGTQIFAPSRLGGLPHPHNAAFKPRNVSSGSDSEVPPDTQPFGAQTRPHSAVSVGQIPSLTASQVYTDHVPAYSRGASPMDVVSDSPRDPSPTVTTYTSLERFRGSPSRNRSPHSLESAAISLDRSISVIIQNDDAFLYFEPEDDNPPANMPSTSSMVTPVKKTQARKKTKSIPTKCAKSPTNGGKLKDESLESLETRMIPMIQRNTQLYLRILRYEVWHSQAAWS
ncbi:hypothetical protein DXG01_003095 [Tephrocybe rancida]|nr:hypothetical protein DXG01_003095 [Tephrocybe rancida]